MLTRVTLAIAVAAIAGCKGGGQKKAAVAMTPPAIDAAPLPAIDAASAPAIAIDAAAAMPAAVAGCTPVEPHQRSGKATVSVVGDGLDVHDVVAPAICGALHTEATRRFAVGD